MRWYWFRKICADKKRIYIASVYWRNEITIEKAKMKERKEQQYMQKKMAIDIPCSCITWKGKLKSITISNNKSHDQCRNRNETWAAEESGMRNRRKTWTWVEKTSNGMRVYDKIKHVKGKELKRRSKVGRC